MIHYDIQAAYRGMVSRANLIVASHRMSRTIVPRQPRKLFEQQLRSLDKTQRYKSYAIASKSFSSRSVSDSIISTGQRASRFTTNTKQSNRRSIVHSKKKTCAEVSIASGLRRGCSYTRHADADGRRRSCLVPCPASSGPDQVRLRRTCSSRAGVV